MTNDEYGEKVMQMNPMELLDEILENPEYLSDPYYRVISDFYYKRANQLKMGVV